MGHSHSQILRPLAVKEVKTCQTGCLLQHIFNFFSWMTEYPAKKLGMQHESQQAPLNILSLCAPALWDIIKWAAEFFSPNSTHV